MHHSELRQALIAAIAHSDEPMVLADPHAPDCPIIAVNPAFTTLTGYEAADIVGRNCRFLQGASTDKASRDRIRSHVQAGRGCIEWIVNYRRDGSRFWNLLFLSPVRDTSGTIMFYFGNQFDITHGMPAWVDSIQMGGAHLPADLEAEFHAVLAEVNAAGQAQGLQRVITAARRLAELSTSLAPEEN